MHHGSQVKAQATTQARVECHLCPNAKLPVFGPGLVAVLCTEGLVHRPAASLSHSEVLASIACAQGVEGCRAVTSIAAYDCTLAAAATDSTLHPNSVSTDVVKALVGIADIAWDHTQVCLPQSVNLQKSEIMSSLTKL